MKYEFEEKIEFLLNSIKNLRFNEILQKRFFDWIFYDYINSDVSRWPMLIVSDNVNERKQLINVIHELMLYYRKTDGKVYTFKEETTEEDIISYLENNEKRMTVIKYPHLSEVVLKYLYRQYLVPESFKMECHFSFPIIIDLSVGEYIEIVLKYPALLHVRGIDIFGEDQKLWIAIIEHIKKKRESDLQTDLYINQKLNQILQEDIISSFEVEFIIRAFQKGSPNCNSQSINIDTEDDELNALADALYRDIELIQVDCDGIVRLSDSSEDDINPQIPNTNFA